MKHSIYMNRTALLSILALGFRVNAAQAEEDRPPLIQIAVPVEQLSAPMPPEVVASAREVDPGGTPNPNPFVTVDVLTDLDPHDEHGAVKLDATARILFARGETDKAIALQTQAVEKAKETAAKFAETLAKYNGRPVETLDARAKQITQKLESIIIPDINFEKIGIDEAIDFLRGRASELDDTADEKLKGLNFFVVRPAINNTSGVELNQDGQAVIGSLKLRNVPVGTVLKYLCKLTNYRFSVDNYAVTLEPASAN
jgi:hypothetical protein